MTPGVTWGWRGEAQESHQQVTDASLLGLAVHRGGLLATLDRHITALTEPKSPEHKALETIG